MGRKDLDYLQWLQSNARAYLTVLAILTFLVSLSFCLFYSNPWQPQKDGISFLAGRDNGETTEKQHVADEQKTEAELEDEITSTEVEGKQQAAAPLPAKDVSVKKNEPSAVGAMDQQEKATPELSDEPDVQQPNAVKQQQEQTTNQNSAERTEQQSQPASQNPVQINGFTAPCQGALLYPYGVGYDPIYEDYRFHDELCYQADGGQITAATAGIVQTVALEQQAQLSVHYGNYIIQYSGLQTCDVQVGDTLTAGQPIGNAEEYLSVKAYRQ